MNLFSIIGLFIGIPCFILGVFTLIKARNKQHYIWALFSLSVALWGFGGYVIAMSASADGAIIWWRLSYIGVILIPALLTHFIFELLQLKKKWLIGIIYFITSVFLILNLFTVVFISQVRFVFDQFYYLSTPTLIYNLFVVWFVVIIIYCHLKLIQAYRNNKGIIREQIKYILLATIIGFSGGAFAFLPVYRIDIYPVLNFTIFFSPFIVAYSILRYRLMDIRLVVRKVYIYFGSAFFAYITFYLITLIENKLFGSVWSTSALIFGVLLAVLFAFIYGLFVSLLNKLANKHLFSEYYNYQETLRKLSEELNHLIDLNKISQSIVTTIKKTINLDKMALLIINDEEIDIKASKLSGFNMDQCLGLLQDNLFLKYIKKQGSLVSDELLPRSQNEQNKNRTKDFNKLKNLMDGLDVSLAIAIKSPQRFIGLIILGSKINGNAYSKEDLDLLLTLSNQLGVTIDNARLYSKVQEFNKTLKQKVAEQTKDINQKNKDITKKNQYLQELLEMKSDFLRVVNHQLNTPLSIIKNAYSMVKEKTFSPDKGFDYSSSALKRLDDTVHDFWDAYELEGNKMKMNPIQVDIEKAVNNLIIEKQKMDLTLQRKIKVSAIKPAFKIPLVWCDSKKIIHVISNLLDNAIYYTREGSVTVTYELANKKTLKLNIIDTGTGISDEDKKRLFQKFSRGTASTNLHPDGSGLGLYIAKKIVEGNDGELTYFSLGPNKGATFSFTIPIYTNQNPISEGKLDYITRDKNILEFKQVKPVKDKSKK